MVRWVWLLIGVGNWSFLPYAGTLSFDCLLSYAILPSMNRIDLTGKRYGRWLVVAYSGPRKHDQPTAGSTWLCRCDCGTERSGILYGALTSGASKSCGCYHKEQMKLRNTKYNDKPADHKAIYAIWLGIKTRCYNTEHPSFKGYGARGIKMCDLWLNDFQSFYADIGKRPSKQFSLDRRDNNGNYEPGNTRWVTRSTQMLNTRANRIFEWDGQNLSLTTICRKTDTRYASMYQRVITQGMDLHEAIQDCRSRGLTFFERAAEYGSHKDNRITNIKRKRRTREELRTVGAFPLRAINPPV